MRRNPLLFLAGIILALSICSGCFAESAGKGKTADDQTDNRYTFAVVLPADDGFRSLVSEGKNSVSLQDALNVFVAAVEDMGHSVVLQGATKDNNNSTLRYRTADGSGTVNWKNMPQTGNDSTLSSTIGVLKKDAYSEYDRLIVISGHLSRTSLTGKQKINANVPTYLFQLSSFGGDSTLLSKYATIAGLKTKQQNATKNGFSVYSASRTDKNDPVDTQIKFKEYPSFRGDQFLNELLTETLFDGAVVNQSAEFVLPSSLVSNAYLMVTGKSINELTLVSPEGTRYPVGNKKVSGTSTSVRTVSYGNKTLKLISMKEILSFGTWKIENGGQDCSSSLFYNINSNAKEIIQAATIFDERDKADAYPKGNVTFRASEDNIIRELYAIYPSLQMKITDTVNNAVIREATAKKATPDQVKIKFTEGGRHKLVFRLMNGKEEICKQTVKVTVQDKLPVFNRSEEEEFVVYPDTGDEKTWSWPVSDWFSDPDGDVITITKKGGDTKKIRLTEDNLLQLTLDDEEDSDGSEEVTLIAKSDTGSTTGTVRIVWRYLRPKLEKLLIKSCVIVPANEGGSLGKRDNVILEMTVNNYERDRDQLIQQLSACEAVALDQDGNKVADASLDDEWTFRSEPFELPDTKGEYQWTLQLVAKEGKQPQWSFSKTTDNITITNQAPVIDESALSDDVVGEHYVLDYNDWAFQIPEKLYIDPEGDPMTYTVEVEQDGKTTKELAVQSGEEAEPIRMDGFGDYIIRIRAVDNEDLSASKNITIPVQIINLEKSLDELEDKSSLIIEPDKTQYDKKDQIVLTLKFDKSGWSPRGEEAFTEWLLACVPTLLEDGEIKQNVDIQYNEKEQTFTTSEFTVPNIGKKCEYQLILNSKEGTEHAVKIEKKIDLTVANKDPVIDPKPGDEGKWVFKAEEEQYQINEGIIIDPEEDIVKRNITVIYNASESDQEVLLEEEIDALPYIIQFNKPFSFFQLKQSYNITFSVEDNDGQKDEFTIRYELKNKQLLIIIIAAAATLLLIIISIVLYAIHRKNLPEFGGAICFTCKGEAVSAEIALDPWKKQKSIPVTIFAGAISILLNESQWDDLRRLELRPKKQKGSKKEKGFQLYELKDKEPQVLPYNMSDGLRLEEVKPSNSSEQ